ncbi:FYN-binding protein 1 isoform X2 [Electrophorus electricus]|uniref:FYN-binding protein 1 isoform X2 n=1 Tax=Electrophorus electricus TaxID=8005 RepID=UPI000F09E6CF|nr:FYN-binding protein 1 isoform X2 [Electrophorus electricus]
MGENVDVKALRARFHAQAERGTSESCAPSRPQASGPMSESSINGVVRNKVSPIVPRSSLPVNSRTEPKRMSQPPQGVFPKPPPSHYAGSKEEPKAPFTNPENMGKVKLTGDFLKNQMLKQHAEWKPKVSNRPILPSQRSMSEVPPLRKPLPPPGPRPLKPKRPPSVRLDHLRKKALAPLPQGCPEKKTHDGPVWPPNKPSRLSQSFSKLNVEPDQDTYDDIDLPPPPPPPPKLSSRESWTGSFSSQESDQGDIYEHIEDQEVMMPVSEKKKQKELKREQELNKKEQKEKLKRENEYRKKFKLSGEVEVLHTARLRTDWHGGKNDLRVRQGEIVEIIRIKDTPEGKWLARNMNREYGYISNACVDVDYEAVKRKLRVETMPSSYPPPVQNEDVYDDISSDALNSSFNLTNEVYDDVDHIIPDEFPLPPPEICHDPKMSKKLEKEEKEFRKRFKFEGPIKVHYCMMVDPNANIKKSGGKDLSVVQGEILEVIEQTNEKKVLCRNEQGKYGYVPRCYLLQPENEVYDDIDNMKA